MKIKSLIVLIAMLGMIFASFTVIPINRVYASNPVSTISGDNNETSAGIWTFSNKFVVHHTGDDIVFIVQFTLRVGGGEAEPSVIFTPAMTNTCNRAVGHVDATSGNTVTIYKCLAETAGNYSLEITETGNSCVGLGNPCGFVFYVAYELVGSGYGYEVTDGLGVYGNPAVTTHNSIGYNSSGFGIGAMALAEVTGRTAGAGFSIDNCQIYGGIYYFLCTQSENFGSTATTNFPFTTDGSGGGSEEGIIVFTLCSTTVTITSTNYNATSTITSTTFQDLSFDYTNLWVLFLIVAVVFASAIIVIRKLIQAKE